MSDRIAGIVILIFALWYGFGASRLKAGFGSGPIGPKNFPLMLALLLALVAIAIIVTGSSFKPKWPKRENWLDIWLVIASFVAYAYLIVPIGFIAATTLETGLVSQRFGAKWWQALATGFGISVALYALFVWVLGVSLPIGRIFRG
ncbi:MAG: tripartite tricarboxylate transporter TctB family protein [Trueperaceae bacterium]|nr:tripartite tricarboxylate transporter TctB family protein [Trueperaceae bacterium]